MQLEQINHVFGISLTGIEKNGFHSSNIQLNSNIYQNVLSKIENKYGNQFLKFDISPENYMKYKNGKVSSMIKSDTGGIGKHAGFEAVEMVNIVDSIFIEVDRYYTAQIISYFNNSVNKIFQAINAYQYQISQVTDLIIDLKEQEQIEELASFKYFFEDTKDELGEIATSSIRATSYITNLGNIRIKNYKVYRFFIKKLNNWISTILAYDSFNQNYINNPINFNKLEEDFYFARQSISTYMICLVYEHIICGNIDLKSQEKIIIKLENFLRQFKDVEQKIRQALVDRFNSNNYYNHWNWYRQDKQYDNDSISWFINKCDNEPEFEISMVKDIFNKSANILENIIIEEDKSKL
jgi:hypothetical protein